MRENWSALYHGGLDKVYSVYSEYTLKFGFVKVWTKKYTVCYIFGIMWTFDIIMICVVEVLSYNSWIKRKYEIFTFSIMTFVQPHWNMLHAIGFSFLLRIWRGHIHKRKCLFREQCTLGLQHPLNTHQCTCMRIFTCIALILFYLESLGTDGVSKIFLTEPLHENIFCDILKLPPQRSSPSANNCAYVPTA